ncbi:MAG: dockerin type I domain-containing protein [Oscillospiraceae bacterium]|nr:dockerin type I domain-containing protein [Oscillospiraceae bacterium]
MKRKIISLFLSVIFTLSVIADPGLCKAEGSETQTGKISDSDYGDLNCDSEINVFDAVRLKRAVLENNVDNIDIRRSDLDGDKEITAADYMELSMYIMNYIPQFTYMLADDTDSDGICDYLEKEMYYTDPGSADSDSDGLTDYEEIFLCHTDPSAPDSNDAENDTDNDKLSNIEEVKYNTDPTSSDTDSDGLSDYDEINLYKTDPLLPDTDWDSVSDYGETVLKTDPLVITAFDKETYFDQEISENSEVLTSINTPENKYKLSLKLNASGYAEDNLSAMKSSYSGYIHNSREYSAILGDIVDISYSDLYSIRNAELYFDLNDESAQEYAVFKYEEDLNMLMPVETFYTDDDHTAYITDARTGTYCVMNIKKWYSCMGASAGEPSQDRNNVQAGQPVLTDSKINVLFMIDLRYVSNLCDISEEITQASEELFNKYSDRVEVEICEFSQAGGTVTVSQWETLTCIEEVEMALSALEPYYGMFCNLHARYLLSVMETPLDVAYSIYKEKQNGMNLVFTFASNEYGDNLYPEDMFTKISNISDFHVSYIAPTETATHLIDYVSKYTTKYRGKIFYAGENLNKEITDFIVACKNKSKKPTNFWNYYYNNVMKKGWEDGSAENIPDTDGDGVNDAGEINFICVKGYDENDDAIVKTTKEIVEELPTETQEGVEWLCKRLKDYGLDYSAFLDSELLLLHSYPDLIDSDGDGIRDDIDASPSFEYDSCFELTDYHTRDPFSVMYQGLIDTMENYYYEKGVKYDGLDKTYESQTVTPADVALKAGLMIGSVGVIFPLTPNLFKKLLNRKGDNKFTLRSMPVAAECLQSYTANNKRLKSLPYFSCAVGGTREQRERYYNHMNKMMSCCENILKPGNDVIIKNRQESPAFVMNFEVNGTDGTFSKATGTELDWYIGVGGGHNGIVSDVKCYEENNEIHYQAKVSYFLTDVYDWSPSGEKELYHLHTSGVCKSYYDYGVYDTTITWKKGARYPRYSDVWSTDIDVTSFDGIEDTQLENAYENAKKIFPSQKQ